MTELFACARITTKLVYLKGRRLAGLPPGCKRAGNRQVREACGMSKHLTVAIIGTILFVGCIASGGAVSYQPVPGWASWLNVEVWDPVQGVEYGKARIDYTNWLDEPSGYWYYAYRIFNNDPGTPSNLDDDYHFGWLKNPVSGSETTYDSINKFSLNLDPDGDGSGPGDLEILDAQGGSSAGGGAWGHSPDPGNRGVDWAVSLGSGTPLQIAPTRHQWKRVGGKWNWYFYADGDTSRNDAMGQYFQVASRWAPGPTMAALAAGVDKQAGGLVMGPVVPEPSSLVGLLTASGLAGVSVLRRRRRPS